jgi:enoyl reductase-like protein
MDNIILFQAYQRVYFASDSLEKEHIQQIAEFTNVILPGDASVHTVEPVSTISIQERLDNILNTIYRLGLNQVRMMSADAKAVQSDKTIREEKESVVALVQSEMETIENIVNNGIRLYAKYLGKEETELERVTFDTEVGFEDIDRFVKLVMAFKDDAMKLPKLRKAQIRKYIQEAGFPDQEELLEEVENSVQAEAETPRVDPLSLFRREVADESESD